MPKFLQLKTYCLRFFSHMVSAQVASGQRYNNSCKPIKGYFRIILKILYLNFTLYVILTANEFVTSYVHYEQELTDAELTRGEELKYKGYRAGDAENRLLRYTRRNIGDKVIDFHYRNKVRL